ncbi:MAG: hypothetical protein LBL43_00980 [Treponema sp.]|jgi:hypothetical protein|nr:hypothetical protein [Treponema sp.]
MRGAGAFLIFFFIAGFLGAQDAASEGPGNAAAGENSQPGGGPDGEPDSFVGLTLDALIGRFGPPRSVYAVRGIEEWQDDVVFVYPQGDFYFYRDRVWQVGVPSAAGIKTGDPRGVVMLVLGSGVRDRGDYALCDLAGGDWPLTLRCNFDRAGKVTAIFIYRSGL